MPVGAWGTYGAERLRTAAERSGENVEQMGSLALVGASGAEVDGWRCWLAGRLFNAEELAKRLGVSRDLNASALAAHACARYGVDACLQLRGAFMMVAATRELALVTCDQLTSRPLVYANTPDKGVLFAEHDRDIVDLLPTTPSPNRLALTQLIDVGCVPFGTTVREGVARVPPGHRLVLSQRGVAVERYWIPRYEGVAAGSPQALAERLRDEAFAAIDRLAGGARRPAVRLSGGLDSSCVAAGLAARQEPAAEQPIAFGAVFPKTPETDESDLIQATARYTGLSVEPVALRDHTSLLIPALGHMERWGLPPATPNLFIWEPVMARARSLGVDMMLDGEGGDELFGIAPYLIADMLRGGRPLAAWSLTGSVPGIGRNPDARVRALVLRRFGLVPLLPQLVRKHRRRRRAGRLEGSLLAREDALALADLNDAPMGRVLDGPMWWRMLAEELVYGRERLDIAGHGRRHAIDEHIESGHPFLYDVELLHVVLTTPPRLQFDPERDRVLLRNALADRIPESVRTRRAKADFTPLLLAGLEAESAAILERLAMPDAPIRAYVEGGPLDRLIERRTLGWPLGQAGLVWRVGMVDTWLRACERPQYPQELAREIAARAG